MINSKYDLIITNIAESGFNAYYTKGINMKLSDGVTVIDIYKPGMCPYNKEEVYKDAIIRVSGNSKNVFTYFDMKKMNQAIEEAIDLLNKENENIIDREKESTYEHIKAPQLELKKTSAIKFQDLEIGGVYLDEKKKKWIFLGQGTLTENGVQQNCSNSGLDYAEYMYMEYEEEKLEIINTNEFKSEYFPHPGTYASKKRFFEKYCQLPVNLKAPIILNCGSAKFICMHGVKPKSYYDQMAYDANGKTI